MASFNGRLIPGADPKSLEVASNKFGFATSYAKDESHVFIEGKIIPDADPQSFTVAFDNQGLATSYSFDANHVYTISEMGLDYDSATTVPNVTPEHFQYLNEFWIKDSEHVYDSIGDIIDGASPSSFQALGSSLYGADDKAVYFLSNSPVVLGADPKTFVGLDLADSCGSGCIYDGYDNQHLYLQGKVVR